MIRAATAGCLVLAAASAAGHASPQLSEKNQAMAQYVAAVSAMAEHCGLDWQRRVFLRYTAILRREGLSEPEVALFSALHGGHMEFAKARMVEPCTPKIRAELEELLPN